MTMAGLGGALETAKNALLTQQILIQTASHNIANADNPAYARQTATVVTTTPSRITAGWIGNGTTVAQIIQSRDAYVDKQLITGVSQEADYRTRSSLLSPVASFLQDDGSSGLSEALGAFWNAWDSLAQNPGGMTEKQNVVTAAQNLADGIRSAYEGLSSQGADLQLQIGDNVDKVNALLERIAGLNRQISSYEISGQKANDLRDLRYQALEDLSAYIGISYSEEADGSLTVTTTDGGTTYDLVSGGQYGGLGYYTDSNGDPHIRYLGVGGDPATPGDWTSPATNSLTGGSLDGLLTVWNKAFSTTNSSSYISDLNTFAANLVAAVNDAYDITHANSVFDPTSTDASNISVDPGFRSATFDPANAVAIAELQNTGLSPLGNRTLGEYLATIQHQIGADLQDASSRADFQKSLLSELQALQQSASGVNIDEEMINLIKYEQVYQAASKVISTTRDLMDTLMQMI
jgi:flagellar hook-associated protein 1 FlgK